MGQRIITDESFEKAQRKVIELHKAGSGWRDAMLSALDALCVEAEPQAPKPPLLLNPGARLVAQDGDELVAVESPFDKDEIGIVNLATFRLLSVNDSPWQPAVLWGRCLAVLGVEVEGD